MALLGQARFLGGIGSILMLLSFIPYVGPALALIGFILVLVAIKYISNYVGDRSIFNNYLIAVILGIIATIVGAVMSALGMLGSISLMGIEDPTAVFTGAILTIMAAFITIWIIWIAAAIFIRRSFNAIASAINVRMFSTAALLYLIGAVLIIAFGVGFILIFIASLLQIIAFFQIPASRAP